jgi:hypothetical protein
MSQALAAIVKELSKHVLPVAPAIDKARIIYDWIVNNIEYDLDRKKSVDNGIDCSPHPPEKVIELRKGICSDMALLYVKMAKEMGLCAHYVHVDVDCKGNEVNHACAAIKTKAGHVLIDPAYRAFDAKHQRYRIKNPEIRQENKIMPHIRKKRRIGRYAAAGIALFYGVCSYFSSATGASAPRSESITLLEVDSGARFVSQNGVMKYNYDKETSRAMKEYIFFCEAREGPLPDNKILDKYIAADKNNDGEISQLEAQIALAAARDAYSRKN